MHKIVFFISISFLSLCHTHEPYYIRIFNRSPFPCAITVFDPTHAKISKEIVLPKNWITILSDDTSTYIHAACQVGDHRATCFFHCCTHPEVSYIIYVHHPLDSREETPHLFLSALYNPD